jgi:GNAT superfamily N-acetyltransferase
MPDGTISPVGAGPQSDARCRLATRADAPALVHLLSELIRYHRVKPPATLALRNVLEQALSGGTQLFLLAESGAGEPLGACELLPVWDPWTGGRACELRELVVTAGMRGRGIGRMLVEQASATARMLGCGRLYLLTETWNREGPALYRRLGFTEKSALYFERTL